MVSVQAAEVLNSDFPGDFQVVFSSVPSGPGSTVSLSTDDAEPVAVGVGGVCRLSCGAVCSLIGR